MKRTLVTSALPYANGYIHLGHCAGAYLTADMYARHMRLSGDEVLYICGSDEHGVAITIAAAQEKVKPQDIIDKYHYANKEAFAKLGITFDIYSRTSHEIHHETAKEFFTDFLEKGYLVEKEEGQFYDPKANMYLPDRYVEGECPNCGNESARGDQCDNCGAHYGQLDLKNPVSSVTGEKPVIKKTTHWYLQLGKFQDFLEGYIESHSKDWKENVLQQTRSWLKQGLSERAITRDLDWGVKIEGLPGVDSAKAKGKVLYVWFDAVLGYISATKELMIKLEKSGKAEAGDWNKWWRSKDTRYIAFIGKDNIVFHTLIFPAMLHGKGSDYILPDNVPANEFLNLEGKKLSKSRNWTIDLKDYLEDFPEGHYIDAMRYALAMNFPETRDSDFTWRDFQARNNNELSGIFGNFINRALQFAHKNFDGKTPGLSGKYKNLEEDWRRLAKFFENEDGEPGLEKINVLAARLDTDFNKNDILMIWAIWSGKNKIAALYREFKFRAAVNETMNLARAANKYFNDEEPWKTAKSDMQLCAKTLFICIQAARALAVFFAPALPHTSGKIFEFLNMDKFTGESAGGIQNKDNSWGAAALPLVPQGRKIEKPTLLFTKVEDETVERQAAMLGQPENTDKEPEKFKLISIDDFSKVKLRAAKVLEAEKVKKSKKLIKLKVDTGGATRQVLAGVAGHYKPEELIGKTIVIVANLKPAKLMGIESQGMALAATNDSGELCFVTPEKDIINPGAEVR